MERKDIDKMEQNMHKIKEFVIFDRTFPKSL